MSSPSVYFSDSSIALKKKSGLEKLEWDKLHSLSFFYITPVKAPGLYRLMTSGKIGNVYFKITGKNGESFKNKFTNVNGIRMQNIVKLIIEKTTKEPQIIEGTEASLDHTIDYQGKTPRRQGGTLVNLAGKMVKQAKLKWEF